MFALLSPRVWIAVALAVALAASHWKAYTLGEKTVQDEWQAERFATTTASLKLAEISAAKTAKLQADSDQLKKAKNVQIAKLDAALGDALGRLRDRPERPSQSSVPSDPSAGPVAGCTGAQLWRSDAEFLARESARADRLLADLAQCQTAYDAAREALIEVSPP